jgi:hypothetical protein
MLNPWKNQSVSIPPGNIGLMKVNSHGTDVWVMTRQIDLVTSVWPEIFSRVSRVDAHRNPVARLPAAHVTELSPDGSNLVQLLATARLSSADFPNSQELLEGLLGHMRTIFPEIRSIRTESSPIQGDPARTEVEIKIDLTSGRTASLTNSGTGVQ